MYKMPKLHTLPVTYNISRCEVRRHTVNYNNRKVRALVVTFVVFFVLMVYARGWVQNEIDLCGETM